VDRLQPRSRAAPLHEGAPFPILERHQLRGFDFEQQAEFIRAVLARYTCTYLDIVSAFVSIKKTLTTSGRNVTFKAGRGGNDGHADIAWTTMHILMNEPLDGKEKPRGTMEIIE